MTFTVRLLGCEVLALTWGDHSTADDKGDVTTMPVGFAPSMPEMTAGRYGMDDQ